MLYLYYIHFKHCTVYTQPRAGVLNQIELRTGCMLVVVQIVDDIRYVLLQSVIHAMRNLSNCLTHYINQSSVRHYTNDKIIRV